MKAILLGVSWIQSGPYVQVQQVDSMEACQVAAEETSRMIAGQALSNMTGPHRNLTLVTDEKSGELRLLTDTIGREVIRISCVQQPQGKKSGG